MDLATKFQKERERLTEQAKQLADDNGVIVERHVPPKVGRGQSTDEITLTGRTVTVDEYVANGMKVFRESLDL